MKCEANVPEERFRLILLLPLLALALLPQVGDVTEKIRERVKFDRILENRSLDSDRRNRIDDVGS